MGFGFGLMAGLMALLAASGTSADSTFSPLKPPAIPLAVRSPYLSTWLNGDSGGLLAGNWPHFWADQITAWQGFVRVDDTTYNWMGAASGPTTATQTSFSYTSTKSVFTFDVGGLITLTATFLSPVYPDDLLLQSMQFSYLQVSVESLDGAAHDVQVYSDISGEWTSSDNSQVINWEYNSDYNGIAYHQIVLADQTTFTESSDMAQWGTWFFATASADDLTYACGAADTTTRPAFTSSGTLDSTTDTNFRAISDSWPVFAFAKDFGSVTTEQDILFVIGVAQDEVVNYQGTSAAAEALTALWTTQYSTDQDVVVAFYEEWDSAATAAEALDSQIEEDATEDGGDSYAALASLVVRQAFGGLQVAHGSSQDYIFMKEISSDGDCSTVDVIFPTHPILLYLNSTLVKLLLDPLFEYQESGQYPNAWAVHDLGVFPNALGYSSGNDEAMPVEECGDMIIMTLAYAQHSGNTAYLSEHWTLLNQWAQFLIDDSLIPDNQLSTDDFAGTLANQTNLALKGIIGVGAMAEIASLIGETDAAATFNETAQDYITQWMGYGIASAADPPHTTLAYGEDDTYGVLYNLYADSLLGLDLVPDSVYTMQSTFYPTVMLEYGLALDTRHTWAKADWQLFAAAIAESDTKTAIIDKVLSFVESTTTYRPLTDLYDATTGGFPAGGATFIARPVMGGVFAPLALTV